jgi:hypothetical protein
VSTPSLRILVTGSRDWEDYGRVAEALTAAVLHFAEENNLLGPTDYVTVVHGACPTGADRMADDFAGGVCRWTVERHPADWDRYGKAAGFRRNAEMVKAGADICIAFIRNGSAGASHTADLALRAGIPTMRYTA